MNTSDLISLNNKSSALVSEESPAETDTVRKVGLVLKTWPVMNCQSQNTVKLNMGINNTLVAAALLG